MGAFWQGLGLGAGLIIAIGAQNAFVLRQGLKKQHVFLSALICTLCDAALITLGVVGFGTVVSSRLVLTNLAAWGGAIFLFAYGLRAFISVFRAAGLEAEGSVTLSKRDAILTTLAVSLLNPHVYLDTVVLLGGIGGQFTGQNRVFYGVGAVTASVVWFFSLAYGATRLGPLFRRKTAWRLLDAAIGVIMWSTGFSLIREVL